MTSETKKCDIRWSAVQSFTGVNYLNERVTFSFRYCSLCGGRVSDDPQALAGHAEDHSTGEHEKKYVEFLERLREVNREQGWNV